MISYKGKNYKKNMKKNILAIIIGLFIIGGALFVANLDSNGQASIASFETTTSEEEITEEEMIELVDCLKEKGVVIYGSEWCPACSSLVEEFGGYEIIDPIYVECTKEEERCSEEMIETAVPEIQIDGRLCRSNRYPEELAREVGCEF